jgi:hypothetical protein
MFIESFQLLLLELEVTLELEDLEVQICFKLLVHIAAQ